MNGILKKTLPIFATIVLIIVIVISVSAIKKSNAKTPDISDSSDTYLEVKETLGGKTFTYSVTKGKIYSTLKGQIGLSSLITMINTEVLKKETNADGKSYWQLAGETKDENDVLEIYNRMDEDIYGDDNEEDLTDDEKNEKIHDYALAMYSGYGYNVKTVDPITVADLRASEDLVNHYTLVLAKELYAKDALKKAIEEKTDYFSDSDIESYYNSHYNKSYFAIIVPFGSSTQAEVALQQLRLANSSGWRTVEVEETEENSGIYKKETKDYATVEDVVKAFVDLYNTVYAYKGADELIKNDYFTVVVIDEEKLQAAKLAVEDLLEKGVHSFTDAETYKTYHDAAYAALNALKAELESKDVKADGTYKENGVEKALTKLDEAAKLVLDGGTPSENGSIHDLVEAAYDLIKGYNAKSVVFDTENKETPLFWDYDKLYEYDSTLPSKLNNTLSLYSAFTFDDVAASTNDSSATWYTKSSVSNNGVSYLILKLAEVANKELNDEVKAEIKEALTKEKVDEISTTDLETKVCELREKYNVVIYDKELQADYIANCEKYEVEHKKNKKNSDTLVAKLDDKEITVDDLFNFMDKTLGLASAISEITQQRLVVNTYFDKYYDAETGKWTKEGKELKETISANIEAQRLNFLSGAYSYYGYTPSSDYTWEDFMFDINGVKTEKELAMLSLYSSVASDYIKKTIEFVSVNDETEFDKVDFLMNEADALASNAWTLLKNRMNDLITDKFTVNGEHLLVSKYVDPANAYASGTPVSPLDSTAEGAWTDEEKALAKELIEKIYEYLGVSEGTYSTKLNNVVTAFKNAPYDAAGRVVVVDSSNEQYKYTLEYPGGEIDVAKYKSAGLYVKFETLGKFTEGKMVKEFEDAAKAIWAQDKLDNETDRITIYADENGHSIETEFGYHLYINLSSTFVNEYQSVGEDEKSVLPSLQEIRISNMIAALNALITDDTSDAEKEKIEAKVKELEAQLTEDAKTAITTYYAPVIAEFTGSYFSALLQQHDIALMANDTWTNGTVVITLNSAVYTKADIVKMTDVNNESTTKSNLTYLKTEDLDVFNLTKDWLEANK